MNLTKEQKKEKAKELGAELKKAAHLFLTEYQGLKFTELQELRKKLTPLRCRYSIVKNSIVRHALKSAGLDGSEKGMLKGPVALAVGQDDDPVAAARVLVSFGKDFPNLKLKAGFVESKWMSVEECKKLSQIGTKPELLTGLASSLYSAVASAAGVLQAPIRDLVLILKALEEKKGKDQPSGAAAA